MNNPNQIAVKNVLDGWRGRVLEANKILSQISDEQMMNEIVPGRNRGIYLLGHLVAETDRMLPILNFEKLNYPDLAAPFILNPDKTIAELPSVAELRENWVVINEILTKHINTLSAEDWFERHTSISAEDFVKEPHRNKLSIMVSRASHLAYHVGQLSFLRG